MKITLDARMYNFSGIGRYIKFLLSFLPQYFDIELLGYEEDLSNKGFKFIAMKSPIYSPLEQLELKQKIKKTDIFWTPHFNVPIFNIPAKYRVTTIHDVCHLTEYSDLSFIKKLYASFLFKNSIKKSDLVFTVSNFTKKELISKLRLSEKFSKKIKVVYEAFEIDLNLKEKPIGLPENYILYVGNIKKHKNIIGLINAFSIVSKKYPELFLVLVGKKDKFISGNINIEEIVKEKGISSKVVFTGVLTDEELISVYKNAKLLILPSFYEGFGLPPLEAMAHNCPVILSDIEVFQEIYEDSVIYCNPNIEENIAEKISFALENKELIEKLKLKGKNKVKEFSIENIKENYLKYLKSLEEVAS
ncbi:MAG: glycosyltransferase family 4 protein [Brevinematales bacterium]|nr:glycosyltransferase family 4 protein [Brevinematales bacterium]